MIGRTVSHYRILGPLGSGGMGVVYLAEDERLGRQVALKFLPATWSQERMALERFRVEARAASSLSHPGICAIYDIGEDGDTPFIVMEALRGETLRERIVRGPMKVQDVLDIGIQLADALEAAHGQGIVHRDVKPANIFLGDKNRVKVLDFGLAKLMSAPSSLTGRSDTTSPAPLRAPENQITIPGTALGTVSYMSPEQARGEEVDSRTDLFSMGAVLYEMVTGRQAFGGSTTAVVYDAILNRAPRSIAHLNPLAPPRLETVIATALEKDPDLRYQHASDLQAELKRIRRDLDSLSFASSQANISTARASASSLAASPAPQVAAATRRSERAAVVLAILAAAAAGMWVWFGQRSSADRVGDPAAQLVTPAPGPAPGGATAPASAGATVQTPAAGAIPPDASEVEPRPERTVTPAATVRPTVPPPPRPQATSAGAVRESPRPAPTPEATNQASRVPPTPLGAAPTPPPPATEAAPPIQSLPAPDATGGETPAAPSSPTQTPATTPEPSPAATVATPPRTRQVAPSEPVATALPPASPVETDDAAIRRVIRTFERAIETKDIRLFRSVRPGLTPTAETAIRNSFEQVDTQEVDIRVESLSVNGRTATARIARQDTLVTRGRRETRRTTQTLRFEKSPAGWVIAE